MTYDDVKTIAAFGGLLLGIINLAITVYEKFFKKSSVEIEVETPKVKYIDRGYYVFQFDVSLIAKGSSLWIKRIYIENKESFISFKNNDDGRTLVSNQLSIYSALPKTRFDFLGLSEDEMNKKVKDEYKNSIKFDDLKFENGERKTFTIVGDLQSEQLPGEFVEMPLRNWAFVVDNGDRVFKELIEFSPHYTSEKVTVETLLRHEGFRRA